jgi:NHLM bacteriocin system ABC transporter ATP-binding protein
MAMMRASSGAVGELSNRSPLLLDDPECGWRVAAGRVDLFAVELVRGEARGRRHALGTVLPGMALFGLRAHGAGLALLAVGLTGTRLVPLDDLKLEPQERATLIEGWAELLAGASSGVELTRADVLLSPGRPATVGAGTQVASLRTAVWIEDARGLALNGVGLTGVVPLVSGLQLEALTDLTLRPVDGAAALATGAPAREGLEALGEAVLAGLSREVAAAAARDRATVERRKGTERAETERVYASLARVVDHRGEAIAAPGEDPVVAACRIAGEPLGIQVTEPPRLRDESLATRVREVARGSAFRIREVSLDDGWWRHDVGPLIGVEVEGERPVALVRQRGRYELVDPTRGTRAPVDSGLAASLAPIAYMPYACLGRGPASGRKLIALGLLPARADLARLLASAIVLGLLSLLTPIAARAIFTRTVPEGDRGQLLGIALVLLAAALGTATVYLIQALALLRVEARASVGTQAAVIDRLLELPASFFRGFTSGDLGARALAVDTIRQTVTTSVTAVLVALVVALFNLAYVLTFDVGLGLITLGLLLVAVAVLALLVRRQIAPQRRLQAALGQTQALALQILGALPKLRVARAEERAFARWAAGLGRMKDAFVDTQRVFAQLGAFTAAWQALAIAIVLLVVGRVTGSSLSAGDFAAFTTAFATTAAAILGLVGVLAATSQAAVLWERARPIVASAPEVSSGGGIDPGDLRGAVELSHVAFRYAGGGPPVLDDVSFAAAPGEFVAIVGPSGAGKSTLFRVLLGFEEPEAGTVSYDGQSLSDLDARAVRRQLGVVIQNARILAGTIFQNIVGAANLTLDDAWDAAHVAGIAEDIARLPMGMHTFISDSAEAFSGGQRQRLLIARAVVARPRVLLFDEATSALDNRTQAAVSAALDELQATRIVIAHRLSTIRHADQILVLERGRIAERGGYDELMDRGGLFSTLARRQIA